MKKVKPVKVVLLALDACSTLGSNSTITSVEPTVNAALVVTSTTPSPKSGIKPELTSSVVTESHAVGVAVGVAVGDAVGVGVGVVVGSAVGVAVGSAVGVAVGSAVGVAVGVTVGEKVGDTVGSAVGVGVGVAVGPTFNRNALLNVVVPPMELPSPSNTPSVFPGPSVPTSISNVPLTRALSWNVTVPR
jgi:hypothetical protein